MKKTVTLIILFCAFFIQCKKDSHYFNYKAKPIPPKTHGDQPIPIGIVVMWGQSNQTGYNPGANEVLGAMVNPMPNVLMFYKNNNSAVDDGVIQPLEFGKNNNWRINFAQPSCGAEISMAYNLSVENAKRFAICKYAVEGSILVDDGLYNSPAGIWDVNADSARSGILGRHFKIGVYRFLLPFITKLKAQGYAPYIASLHWMQGEADAGVGRLYQATNYEQRLKQLIDSFKIIVNPYASITNTKIIITRIHNRFTPGQRPYLNNIRTAQGNVANYYGGNWIDSDGYDVSSDLTHWTKRGQITHGIDVANIVMPALN